MRMAVEGDAEPFVRFSTIESAPSMPSHIQRHSGRIIAEPAIAASTCSHRPWRRVTSAIAATGSTAVVIVVPVVDYRAGYKGSRWSGLWEEFHCDWRELWFNQHVEPPSWVLADDAIARGAKGITFASTLAPIGTNLVLYHDMLTSVDVLQVYDPAGALPKNEGSWFYGLLDNAWQQVESGIELSAVQTRRLEAASLSLVNFARAAVGGLYPYCGLHAADDRSDINRAWRDFHTATQHALWLQ